MNVDGATKNMLVWIDDEAGKLAEALAALDIPEHNGSNILEAVESLPSDQKTAGTIESYNAVCVQSVHRLQKAFPVAPTGMLCFSLGIQTGLRFARIRQDAVEARFDALIDDALRTGVVPTEVRALFDTTAAEARAAVVRSKEQNGTPVVLEFSKDAAAELLQFANHCSVIDPYTLSYLGGRTAYAHDDRPWSVHLTQEPLNV